MGSKNKFILLVFLLLLATSVLAQEDFIAASQKPVLVACEGATITDIITVKNTGIVASTYTLSMNGGGAKWASPAPTVFTSMPGESVNVYNYITPPFDSRGDYDLSLYVTTDLGLVKTLSQKLSVRNCLNLNLVPKVTSQTICQCNTATYKVTVKNTGSYLEIYSLSLSQFSNYAKFSENPLKLLPGQSEDVYILVNFPCNVFGSKETTLKVYAEKSRFMSSVPLRLDIASCYDFEVAASDSYSICESSATIPVAIINKDAENSYEISMRGPKWASASTNTLDLRTRETKTVDINLNPPPKITGLFDLIVNVNSLKGAVEKTKKIQINKQICYSPEIRVKNNIPVNYSNTIVQVNIKNKGARAATFTLSTQGLSWASIDSSNILLNPGETKAVNLKLIPDKYLKEGNYPLEIKAKVLETNDVYSKKLNIQLKEFRKIPLVYYLSLLTLLLLIILVFILVKFLPKQEEAVKETKLVVRKTEKKPEKAVKKEKPAKAVKKEKPKEPYFEKLAKKITLKHYLILALILLIILLAAVSISKPAYISKIINSTKSINITQPALTTPLKLQTTTPPISLGAVKNFLIAYMYYIIAGILILIAFLVLIIKSKEEPRLKEKPKPKIKQAVKKIEKKAEKKIKPAEKEPEIEKEPIKLPQISFGKWLWYLIAILLLAGIVYIIYKYYPKISGAAYNAFAGISKAISQAFFKSLFLTKVINFISLYRYYVLAGIIILIIFIILLLKSVKPPKKEKEATFESDYWSYISWFLGFVISITIIYFLFRLLIIPYWKYILLGIATLIILLILIALLKKIKTKKTEETIFEETMPNRDSSMVMTNKRFGIGEIILKTRKKRYNVKLSVTKLRRTPTFMRASENVYEYYEINKENINNSDINKAIIRFKVKKSWLDKNEINENNISLKRYSGRWSNIPTKLIDSDDYYFYYESEMDKLSYFAIGITKAERKEKEVAKKWPWIVLLLLLILAGTYIYYSMTQPSQPLSQQEPILKQNFTTQVWDEDTSLTIDLSKYFYDPDNDKLVVTSTKPENIDVDISSMTVVLTPKQNWHGASYIIFTVDDLKGGVISSGKITLIVRDIPEPMLFEKIKGFLSVEYTSAKDFSVNYFNYFIYGIIALVVLLLLVKYNKMILDFFLEEEDDKKNKKRPKK